MTQKKIFAKGYCFQKFFMYFLIGCIIGVVYEQVFEFIKHGILQPRVGLIYGPFNPVYGLGFSLFYLFLGKNNDKRNKLLTYIYCCLIGGATEYLMSYFEQIIFHTQAWNYTGYFLNIQGRTTIPFMMFWGLGGYIMLEYIYPFLSKYIEQIPYQFGNKLVTFLLVFIIFDCVISFSASYRETQRNDGVKASNLADQLLDFYFPDSVMDSIYSNIKAEN